MVDGRGEKRERHIEEVREEKIARTIQPPNVEVIVRMMSGEKIAERHIEPGAELLSKLKLLLEEQFGYPKTAQQLLRQGSVVVDARSLEPWPQHLDFTLVILPFDAAEALRQAARLGHEAAVRMLLSKMDHKSQEWNGMIAGGRALFAAARCGQKAVCGVLLEAVSEAEERSQMLEAADALHAAARNGDATVFHLLLDAAPNKEVRSRMMMESNRYHSHALHETAECGHKVMCSALLAAAAPDRDFCKRMLLAQTYNRKTALHCAALRGQAEICRMLLDAAPTTEVRSTMLQARSWRGTALDVATECGHEMVRCALLEAA